MRSGRIPFDKDTCYQLAAGRKFQQISDILLFAERSLPEQLPADGLALPLAAEVRDEGAAHLVAQRHGSHPSPPSLFTR